MEGLLWTVAIVILAGVSVVALARGIVSHAANHATTTSPIRHQASAPDNVARPTLTATAADPDKATVTKPTAASARTALRDPETRADQSLHPDQSLWSSQRKTAFEKLSELIAPPVVASLVFPRQRARVPVFSGVDELSMTLGAGHLLDTAPLEGEGNIAITAHRDGSFRILKDIEPGDPVHLELGGETRRFIVSGAEVVTPDRVDVLNPTPGTQLTLITCYPFYFVGSAPRRYVLRAELQPPVRSSQGHSASPVRVHQAGGNAR